MSVGTVCTRIVVTAHPEETVRAVAKRMAQYDVGTLVVVDADKPVGIITDRDLVLRVMAQDKAPQELAVREVMTHDLVCVPESTPLEEAMLLLRGYHIRRLVVVSEARNLVGIFSLDDMLLLLGEEHRAVAELMRANRQAAGQRDREGNGL